MKPALGWRDRLHLVNAVVIGALGAVLVYRGITMRSVPLFLMAAAFVGYATFRISGWTRS